MFPAMVRWVELCFAPLERGKSFGGRAFYKHLAPNGAKSNNVEAKGNNVRLHLEVESALYKTCS